MASGRLWASSSFIFRYGCNKEYSRWQSSVRIVWNVIGQWKTSWQYRRGTHLRPVSLAAFNWQRRDSSISVRVLFQPERSSMSECVGALLFIISWCYIYVRRFASCTNSVWGSSLLLRPSLNLPLVCTAGSSHLLWHWINSLLSWSTDEVLFQYVGVDRGISASPLAWLG